MKDEKQKISIEKMRYAVPGVCNRFWQVHAGFIALCAFLAVAVITVALSYSVISVERTLEPRGMCVFFCKTETGGEYADGLRAYNQFADIYFAEYNAGFQSQEEGKKYDFSRLSELYQYENPPEDALLITLDKNKKIKKVYSYAEFGLANGATLSLSQIDGILKGVLKNE